MLILFPAFPALPPPGPDAPELNPLDVGLPLELDDLLPNPDPDCGEGNECVETKLYAELVEFLFENTCNPTPKPPPPLPPPPA